MFQVLQILPVLHIWHILQVMQTLQVSRDCFALQWFEDKLGCHGGVFILLIEIRFSSCDWTAIQTSCFCFHVKSLFRKWGVFGNRVRLCNQFLQRAGKTGFFLSQIVSEEEKYQSTFLPKQIFWIIATTPELSLNTKYANVYKFDGSRSTLLFFRSQTGQQHENIFLSPLPFFLLFVFCSNEKHTCCMWHKNYPNFAVHNLCRNLKISIWDMDEMVGMDGWMNGHPLDSPF